MRFPRWLPGVPVVSVLVLSGLIVAPARADITIGADVSDSSLTRYVCNFMGDGCVVVPTALLNGGPLTSPCEGTVTRFRINGIPSNNTYRLRVLQVSGTTSTAVSASSAVPLMSDGINVFPVSLPIHAGNQLGLEFADSPDFQVVRARQMSQSLTYFNGIPPSGSSSNTTASDLEYLFNADVACTVPAPAKKKKCKKKAKKKSAAASKKRCKKKKKKK